MLSAWIIMSLIIVACTISFGGDELSETELLQTAVAQTISANQAQAQQQAQAEQPTITTAPTDTPPGPPTEVPKPCNAAKFISETVPDGTELALNQNFDKTWRLQNTGTCTWNTSYQLVFAEGDKMGGPSTKNLSGQVAPGEMVDVGVTLKVPDSTGTYKGFWKVRDDQGNYYVNNLWVEIKAKSAIGPVDLVPLLPIEAILVLKPDLVINALEIDPATPKMGLNTHVRVRAKNEGILDSGAFTVQWYGLSTFASPSCNWNVAGGLAAGSSVWLDCDFVFASWYPINKTTIAYIDTTNAVNESNETNNSRSISPFGVNP
jgi:hypothetical protein